MSITYKQLAAFKEVAQATTFAEAADKLHLSQPALSVAIKNLESLVGGRLFDRSTRVVKLSPEGEVFLPVARRLLEDWDKASADIQNLFAMKRGKLTLAAMPSYATGPLPDILSTFHGRWPDINIEVIDVVMESVIKLVSEGRAELGFTFEHEQLGGLDFYPLQQDSFVAVLPRGHQFADNAEIDWPQLVSQPMVMMNRGSSIRRWFDEHLTDLSLQAKPVLEAGQLVTLGEMVKSGMGISVMPGICEASMRDRGLVCVPLSGPSLSRQIGVIASSRAGLSVAAQALLASVTKR